MSCTTPWMKSTAYCGVASPMTLLPCPGRVFLNFISFCVLSFAVLQILTTIYFPHHCSGNECKYRLKVMMHPWSLILLCIIFCSRRQALLLLFLHQWLPLSECRVQPFCYLFWWTLTLWMQNPAISLLLLLPCWWIQTLWMQSPASLMSFCWRLWMLHSLVAFTFVLCLIFFAMFS